MIPNQRTTAGDKAELRQHMLQRRRSLDGVTVVRSSQSICARLLLLPEVVIAPVLAIYAAFAGEVSLDTLFRECKRQGKELLLPRYNSAAGDYEMVSLEDIDTDLTEGALGIREPAPDLDPASAEDLSKDRLAWLVPGVAFDRNGNRLGHGRGYYDRLLRHAAGCKVGVAYDWQIVDALPVAPHDIPMDILVSESRVLRCRDTARLTNPAVSS